MRRVAHLDATLPIELAEGLWCKPEQYLAAGNSLRSVGARRTVRIASGQTPFVLKHYAEPSRRHTLKQLVQPSRAWRTWQMAHRLADAGIATPRPVACIESRWGPFRLDSYLMYPYVAGQRLIAYFTGREAATLDEFQQIWVQLDELWRRLAEMRISLGDANPGNFIISRTGQLWVIDLDKARSHYFSYSAARQLSLRWKQVMRSAAKHGRIGGKSEAA